jgi:luciferase family oxidoreductase group 1
MSAPTLPLPLSILDVVPVSDDTTAGEAIRNSLELARLGDRLGYRRHWFAEHHNMPIIGSTTPSLLIGLAGEVTSRIRVGAGGVMLPNHAPLQVAEAYKMLEALHPGRVDLGIGRAPGTDPTTAIALRRDMAGLGAEDFPERLAELVAFGSGKFPANHPFRSVIAMPEGVPLPPIYLLGSSGFSAQLAARLGMGFGFAAHFSPEPAAGPMRAYRRQFRAGATQTPHAILTVSVIVADSGEEADRLASSMQLAWLRLRTGRAMRLPSPEEAMAYSYTPGEREIVEGQKRLQIVGDAAAVVARIEAMVAETEADEVMVMTTTYSHEARLRSYELLAAAFGLAG